MGVMSAVTGRGLISTRSGLPSRRSGRTSQRSPYVHRMSRSWVALSSGNRDAGIRLSKADSPPLLANLPIASLGRTGPLCAIGYWFITVRVRDCSKQKAPAVPGHRRRGRGLR